MKRVVASVAISIFAVNSMACGVHSQEKKPFENYYGVVSAGYSTSTKLKGEYENKKMGTKPIIGLGVKTDLSDNIKMGLNLEYRPDYKARLDRTETGTTNIVSGKFSIIPLMLTSSYEFKYLSESVIPYVDFGLGVARVNSKGLYQFGSGVHKAKKTSYNFAYSAGLGAVMPLTEDTRLGFGYKYSDFGNTNSKFKRLEAYNKVKNLKTHDLLASLEVKF